MLLTLLLCLALQEPPLAPAEIDLLELPFHDGLFNPAAAGVQRVRAKIELRTCYGKKKPYNAPAWFVPAAPGRPARLVLNNLQEVDAPHERIPVPFPDPDYSAEAERPSFSDVGIWKQFGRAQTFLFAAWSHRLGRDDEAARLLRSIKPEKLMEEVRAAYGWELFSDAVNAFMVADDADALSAVERLVRFESGYRGQGEQLRADLLRRRQAGTFGKRTSLPADLDSRPMDDKIAILIGTLDQLEIDPKNYGDMNLNRQAAARQLADCGEAAVPALLRCFASDPRLTRSVGVWREWQPSRTVLSVRAAAFRVLVAILRTDHWESGVKPRWMDPDDLEGYKTWSTILERYWEKNRKIPFPERMMRILRDPTSTIEEIHQASENLARLDQPPVVDAWRRTYPADQPLVRELRSEVASFKDPTVGEAILAAMDRHMKAVASIGNWAECAERDYLIYLAELGDRRIVPVLRGRFDSAKMPETQWRMAFLLRRLGEAEPLDALARGLETSKPPGAAEAFHIVELLGKGATPACDDALAGFVRKDHPWHALAKESILGSSYSDEGWVTHPYCLSLLAAKLKEEEFTGGVVTGQGDEVLRSGTIWPNGFYYQMRSGLPKERSDRAAERICDLAASKLSELLPDAPPYHPLLLNAGERMRELRVYVDRHLGHFRRLTSAEMDDRGLPWCYAYWVAR